MARNLGHLTAIKLKKFVNLSFINTETGEVIYDSNSQEFAGNGN